MRLASIRGMSRDDDLRIRLGRIRDQGRTRRTKPFVAQVLAATEKSGGLHSRRKARGSAFGRGRAASLAALRRLSDRSRSVTVKARVVRHRPHWTPLKAHLAYLRREGVTKDGAAGRMFDAECNEADASALAERCQDDRHHFRFIVSPQDAERFADLKAFARELMAQAERDLGTKLDWIGADHWNSEHPHVHIVLRGRAADSGDLVIARDYISHGLRARAAHLVTLELGPRSDHEIRQDLEAQAEADRWTRLDQALAREAARHEGVVDLRPGVDDLAKGPMRSVMIGRMRKLERLGLAAPLGPARWRLSEQAEPTLRTLGERTDIIKRIHRGLADYRIERNVSDFALDDHGASGPIVGRLMARGLDDELRGTAYAVIDGVDGRVHHLRFGSLEATSDAAPGGLVELRRFDDAAGRRRVALAVRSDLQIDTLIRADGATWLDRQLLGRHPASLSSTGFGREVRAAMEARIEHLIRQGFAKREGQRITFARNLLETLRARELEATAARISSSGGLQYRAATEGENVAGVYRQRVDLASGRFAMIDDGRGFTLVPWSPTLDRRLSQQVSGVARASRIEWSFARARGPAVG